MSACAAICPDGVMPTSRKNNSRKSPSTASEQNETSVLRDRIRELEDALAALQATQGTSDPSLVANPSSPPIQEEISETSDPLFLSEDLLESLGGVDELTENLGTLSMTGYGKSRFFGSGGGALVGLNTLNFHRITKEERKGPVSTLESYLQDLPAEIIYLGSAFLPRQTLNSLTIGDWMVANLPPLEEASSLCETFFENGAYLVFALGELFDIERPARPTGGNRFYYLARAALALEPLYDQPTLTAVQALVVAYTISAINVRLCFALGLHRDWEKFNQNVRGHPESEHVIHTPKPVEQEIRRVIFSAVTHFESWQCMQYGRPSQLTISQFDFAPPGIYPERDSYMETQHMKSMTLFCLSTLGLKVFLVGLDQTWTYNFCRDCIIPVLNVIAAVKPPNYSEIIKLEKKLRDYPPSEASRISGYDQLDAPASEKLSRGFRIMRFSVLSQLEVLLLCLHRQYFSYAMTDYSRDPLGCPFARSVFVSFVASCEIVSNITCLFQQEPKLSIRDTATYSVPGIPSNESDFCKVFGAIVIRCPDCTLASTALDQLDKACGLLYNAREGFKAGTILPHVLALRDKAHAAYDSYYSSNGTTQHAVIDISKELSVLGGRSQVSPYASSSARSPASTTGDTQRSSSVEKTESILSSGSVPSIPPTTQFAPPPVVQTSGFDALQPMMDLSQWNNNPSDTYDTLPQTNMSPLSEGVYMGGGDSQDWTNQLFTLFSSNENNSLAGFHTNMTYPDPPINPAAQHTSWETFINHVLQF
ncbi:hypothetical protein Clacol_005425 [Clathrus columnatus]|uniref:Xylanolytic transcriptional activator regulatory domain-containing protein n=1 Tax=Clathrus columnatus TaxID=1419009 RepID=A0AAV5ACK2_9AGAM|nr:hypothetical protein Clacol_005425 [Clathrus columnatus]